MIAVVNRFRYGWRIVMKKNNFKSISYESQFVLPLNINGKLLYAFVLIEKPQKGVNKHELGREISS